MFTFEGFPEPTTSWYRLPNTWFADWQEIRAKTGRVRITSLVKVTEYVIKHSWGYQNYREPVRISWNDFLKGRRRYGKRVDRGIGLSRGGLQRALDTAVELRLLERPPVGEGEAHTYLPHVRSGEAPVPSALSSLPWGGFAPPQSNFFKVPKVWTDLTAEITSAVTILTVEYCMRHSWGWSGWDGEPRWLTIDEIAQGRRYRSSERAGERYDVGIGYSTRSVSEAVREAVGRGLLVWRETLTGEREFALHLAGMRVDAEGRWLPDARDQQSGEPEAGAGNQGPTSAESPAQPEQTVPNPLVAQLAAQVQQLTRTVQQLSAALAAVEASSDPLGSVTGADRLAGEANRPPAEANRPPHEVNRPPTEGIRPPTEATRPAQSIKTPAKTPESNTQAKKPAADTATRQPAPAGAALPQELQKALHRIHFRSGTSWAELRSAYAQEPQRIEWWIRHLAKTRPGDAAAGGFLLQVVVRGKAPIPDQARRSACTVCDGSGLVFHAGKASRCPACSRSTC